MKDLILITAYCPTEEQEAALEKCIDSVLECGKHILLISHTHIPIHIQKKCQYYVYDYNNDVVDVGFSHGLSEEKLFNCFKPKQFQT